MLRESGVFDEEVLPVIEDGLAYFGQDGIAFLESMISRSEEYDDMDRANCPILIYVGDDTCYGVLEGFARSLGDALERRGWFVEYFDPYGEKVTEIVHLIGKRFRAIIGMQTFVFSVKLKNGENVHDKIVGPKYNMFLDHPIWMREHLNGGPKDYTILTHDTNYAAFIRDYFPHIRDVVLLPPAGELYKGFIGGTADITKRNVMTADREYPLSFIGTYHNWRLWIPQVRQLNRRTKGLVRRYMAYMLAHRFLTWEAGLHGLLSEVDAADILADQKDFEDLLFEIKPACFMVMSYLRERILETVISSGIEIHLFSDSFIGTEFEKASNVILHSEQKGEAVLELYARSKVSLNIMSWHKAGMTERVANMMMNGAVVITDTSRYLEEEYVAGEDYLPFSLDAVDKLPDIIRRILGDEERQQAIRESAYEKAIKKETWDNRAERLEYTFLSPTEPDNTEDDNAIRVR